MQSVDLNLFLPIIESLGVAAIVFILLVGLRLWLLKILESKALSSKRGPLSIAKTLLKQTHTLFLLAFALFMGSIWFDINEDFALYTGKTAFIALLLLAGLWTNVAINIGFDYLEEKYKEKEGMSTAVLSMVKTISKLALAVILFLFILDNLNFEVSTLLAGIGIGGIAVALAVQNILQDLFASLSIIVDKPFLIGDFIIVDNYMGTVEYVGIKTTRVRSLSGEQLIFSNTDLLKSRLRNYKKMRERRIVFTVRITFDTPKEKIEKIPGMLKESISKTPNTRFDRAHFKEIGTYSLDYEVVYFVTKPDYTLYMDVQQEINLAIYQKFAEEKIEFAYPTAKSIRLEPTK